MVIANAVVKLDYDPARDVLFLNWPDFTDYALSETDHVLETVIETIRNYDVKNLLVDTRKGAVRINNMLYKEIKLKFISGLSRTRLEKLARVVSTETSRENIIKEVTQQSQCVFPILNFYKTEEALSWLSTKK